MGRRDQGRKGKERRGHWELTIVNLQLSIPNALLRSLPFSPLVPPLILVRNARSRQYIVR